MVPLWRTNSPAGGSGVCIALSPRQDESHVVPAESIGTAHHVSAIDAFADAVGQVKRWQIGIGLAVPYMRWRFTPLQCHGDEGGLAGTRRTEHVPRQGFRGTAGGAAAEKA